VDPACLPGPVRDRLAVIGYWVCPPDLRDRVEGWDELDKDEAAVAYNDLCLMGEILPAGRECAA
jgi:hypothetical protein